MSQKLKINCTTIKTPNKFDYEAYNLTKSGRVASGEMTMDLIAKKRKFLLNVPAQVKTISPRPARPNAVDGDPLYTVIS